jgi:hypothetical protein
MISGDMNLKIEVVLNASLSLVSGRLGGRFPNTVKRAPDTARVSLILASPWHLALRRHVRCHCRITCHINQIN